MDVPSEVNSQLQAVRTLGRPASDAPNTVG